MSHTCTCLESRKKDYISKSDIKRTEKCFSLLVVFLWTILFDFRWHKLCTTLFGNKNFCALWSVALAKKSCNNINNRHPQVSGLCYFLWLCLGQTLGSQSSLPNMSLSLACFSQKIIHNSVKTYNILIK